MAGWCRGAQVPRHVESTAARHAVAAAHPGPAANSDLGAGCPNPTSKRAPPAFSGLKVGAKPVGSGALSPRPCASSPGEAAKAAQDSSPSSRAACEASGMVRVGWRCKGNEECAPSALQRGLRSCHVEQVTSPCTKNLDRGSQPSPIDPRRAAETDPSCKFGCRPLAPVYCSLGPPRRHLGGSAAARSCHARSSDACAHCYSVPVSHSCNLVAFSTTHRLALASFCSVREMAAAGLCECAAGTRQLRRREGSFALPATEFQCFAVETQDRLLQVCQQPCS
jgi:hypothetical protein